MSKCCHPLRRREERGTLLTSIGGRDASTPSATSWGAMVAARSAGTPSPGTADTVAGSWLSRPWRRCCVAAMLRRRVHIGQMWGSGSLTSMRPQDRARLWSRRRGAGQLGDGGDRGRDRSRAGDRAARAIPGGSCAGWSGRGARLPGRYLHGRAVVHHAAPCALGGCSGRPLRRRGPGAAGPAASSPDRTASPARPARVSTTKTSPRRSTPAALPDRLATAGFGRSTCGVAADGEWFSFAAVKA